MSYRPSYWKGQWKADCDDCGLTYKSSYLKLRWDGLMVCHKCWEPRQPQDFVRAKEDIQATPWTRPEPTDTYQNYCTTNTAIIDFAVAGCAIVNNAVYPGVVPSGTFTL